MGTPRITPLAVTEKSAAAMLDMPRAQFSRLVNRGALPGPVRLADGIERWRVSELTAIIDGKAAHPETDDVFEL